MVGMVSMVGVVHSMRRYPFTVHPGCGRLQCITLGCESRYAIRRSMGQDFSVEQERMHLESYEMLAGCRLLSPPNKLLPLWLRSACTFHSSPSLAAAPPAAAAPGTALACCENR